MKSDEQLAVMLGQRFRSIGKFMPSAWKDFQNVSRRFSLTQSTCFLIEVTKSMSIHRYNECIKEMHPVFVVDLYTEDLEVKGADRICFKHLLHVWVVTDSFSMVFLQQLSLAICIRNLLSMEVDLTMHIFILFRSLLFFIGNSKEYYY